ncbi:hypothetical protein [Acinetobacter stercoris]|uniref:Uncharacterized protein n=1 Tax=Acinetobacter stercoris TaxID=2126983 RepID=A0A2U3MY54_9GAMM|nr:hypothetical protein [Acinetobacter stercoris]SPL70315.1 hypothetical protein KPC_1493 [Acinetobacter stercoris]
MPETNEELRKYLFSLAPITVNQQVEGEKKRTFEGIAYGGGRIIDHWYWGANGVVFDLDGIDIPNPTPLLEEHFGSSRIGVVKEVQLNQNIQVKGHFLSNPAAQQIVEDSDNEFPFQMSLYIIPGSVEEISQGQTVQVNGQTFTGPIAIFRHNRIREFTVCSLGADHTTTLNAFTANQFNQQQEDSDVTELAAEKAAREKAEQERDAAVNELKQFKADQRKTDIEALQKELNTTFSADDIKAYKEMSDEVFAFTSRQLRQFSGKKPEEKQTNPANNLALSQLFNHVAKTPLGQVDQPEQHKFTTGVQAFAAQNKGV